ncbi:MAG: AMP-binding protein [Rhodobacterales bacterium]|nr:AMP-binding protein [Rhodobacterales bacterium]
MATEAIPAPPNLTIAQLIRRRLTADPGDIVAIDIDDRPVTATALAARVNALAGGLADRGLVAGDRVVTLLDNSLDAVALMLACLRHGLTWVPVDPAARGAGLAHILNTADPALVVAAADSRRALSAVGAGAPVVWCDGPHVPLRGAAPPPERSPDIAAILFTSGTTGPPKGVPLTETMMVAAAHSAGIACDAADGDRFLLWEPVRHIGGAQMCVLALMKRIRLVVRRRFSASRFWGDVRRHGITKLHYLGGVLDILMSQPPAPDDADNPAVLAFGAGCRPTLWRAFEARFGVTVREVYGMTEASSFTTINRDGTVGSIGTALPWFDVALLDHDGQPLSKDRVAAGAVGEMAVRPLRPGLVMPGYLDDPEETALVLVDGRLRTGDLARRDAAGHFWYEGRRKDAIRVRGENISAWEVEAALNAHPAVAESAVVGVAAAIGEQEILAFLRPAAGAVVNPAAVLAALDLPDRALPRYVRLVDDFPRTPSHRIRKDALPRDTDDAWFRPD